MLSETKFYEMCEAVEHIGNVTGGYFPTVEELKVRGIHNKKEKYLSMLSYYASNPYKNNEQIMKNKDYVETVKFCKELVGQIDLEEDD